MTIRAAGGSRSPTGSVEPDGSATVPADCEANRNRDAPIGSAVSAHRAGQGRHGEAAGQESCHGGRWSRPTRLRPGR